MKVYACFVIYHPEPERFDRALKSVSPQVDKVIIVDNTFQNEGIARALNKAFEQAETEGCDWLVTFDQDSIAPGGLVEKLLDDTTSLSKVGQIGPAYSGTKNTGAGVVEKDHIITSGSLTSVSAWRAVGGFRDDMFIDYVDIEFSFRLRKNGYKVLMDTDVILDHRLGDGIAGFNLFGKKRLGFIDHAPVRWYYITRNCLFFNKEYKAEFPETVFFVRTMRRRVFRMLVNGKSRAGKFKMVVRGWMDYKKGIMGQRYE